MYKEMYLDSGHGASDQEKIWLLVFDFNSTFLVIIEGTKKIGLPVQKISLLYKEISPPAKLNIHITWSFASILYFW